ncbi:10066_t:CDS:10 [Entrophospora sp. SA101]|nr:10066_t:CDS:10 [Entrophospora sp. SA101]
MEDKIDTFEEDDEFAYLDDLLLNTEKLEYKSSSSIGLDNSLRRSERSRKPNVKEGYVSTVEAVPTRGEIPILERFRSSSNSSFNKICQYSLTSLLREKKRHEKIGYDLSVLEQVIKGGIELENEDPFDTYDRTLISTTLLKDDEQKEQKVEYLQQKPPKPSLKTTRLDAIFTFLSRAASDNEKLKEVLCNDWIAQQYQLGWEMPNEVVFWLLETASFHNDLFIAEAASNTLKNITEIYAMYDIFKKYGASPDLLEIQCSLEDKYKKYETDTSLSEFPYLALFRLSLKSIISLVDVGWLMFKDVEEIRTAIVIILRLCLDARLIQTYSMIEQLISSLLNLIPDDEWIQQLNLSKPSLIKPIWDLFHKSDVFKIGDDTNYKDLYDMIILISYVIDDIDQIKAEENFVKEIIEKLKRLYGRINDTKAAFLDRTKQKAKELSEKIQLNIDNKPKFWHKSFDRDGRLQLYASNEGLAIPYVSPLFAESLGGLPPILVQTGDIEKFRDESIYLAHKAANPEKYNLPYYNAEKFKKSPYKTSTKVVLEVYEEMPHVFQIAVNRTTEFIKRLLSGEEEEKGFKALRVTAKGEIIEGLKKEHYETLEWENIGVVPSSTRKVYSIKPDN